MRTQESAKRRAKRTGHGAACEAPSRKIAPGLGFAHRGCCKWPEGNADRYAGGHRRGSAAIPLILAVLLTIGAAVYFLKQSPGNGSVDGPDPAGIAAPTAPVSPSLDSPDESDGRLTVDPNAPTTVGDIEVRQVGDYGGRRKVFTGTGTIAGSVGLFGGGFPDEWTVHIEPSKVSRGKKSAELRVIESEPDMTTFEARDLPMGAYRVYAAAPSMRSRPVEIALFKLEGMEHLDGMNHVNVTLDLRPMAAVDGTVRSANGDAAEGVPVFLMPHGIQLESPMEAVTDAAGVYRFDAVPQGPWFLQVSSKRKPPVSPVPIKVGTTRMELEDTQLPPLTSIDILVVDEFARPFPDASVTGYLRGTGSGSFRGTTDGLGHLIVRYQSAGPWRIDATSEIDGFKGRVDLSLEANDEPAQHRIIIR